MIYTSLFPVPPTITVPPEDVATEIGQTATFQCAAVGIPAPTVEWFFGTEKVSDGPTISVDNVDQGGTYVCLVTSEAGTDTALAKLIVYGKPISCDMMVITILTLII